MKAFYTTLYVSLLLSSGPVLAQCGAGEVEVTIEITTDNYGFETYWQLVPGENACGDGSIFEGGNLAMDCASAGLQNGEPGGYASNETFLEGPWCLVEGGLYTIHMLDDWGDGQAGVEVFVDGISAVQSGMGQGAANAYTFLAQGPALRDMSVTELTTALFVHVNETVRVRGTVKSFGAEPVTGFHIVYAIDGGPAVNMPVSGVTLQAGDAYGFVHGIPWIPATEGASVLTVVVTNINGGEDLNTANDQMSSSHMISPAILDLADAYLAFQPLITTIANSDQDILVPRDLSFHPESARNQLWVLNKGLDGFPGGSTVTFFHPGEDDETFEWRQDVNSGHFMSLPTAIAMGDNNNFATSPGVFDANHNAGDPFTGPSLWSADTAIYARPTPGNGSHLDMLHMNPNSQGIAHDYWNRFWVVDGYTGDIVMNDFRADHGPGNDYHGNAIIRRYADFTITRDTTDHIVSHNVMDKSTGWLYVIDHGGQRVLRMNVNSGTVIGDATQWDDEPVEEYSMVSGYEWEAIITEGLDQPAGIEVVGTHLYVSDHSNGDIIIYDISGSTFPELGRIHTNTPGLMGITVGPDGRIWGVNATTHELLRIDPQEPTGVDGPTLVSARCWPNPAHDRLYFEVPASMAARGGFVLRDTVGRIVQFGTVTTRITSLSAETLPSGIYSLVIGEAEARSTVRVCITH